MTALRLLDDFRMLTVAAPSYLARHPAPTVPKDLHQHPCIRYRLPWDGSIQPWLYTRNRRDIELAVEGPLIVNDPELLLQAAIDGVGIAFLAEPFVAPHLARGQLTVVLQGWCSMRPGIFLYYPSRRQMPMPLQVFLNFIKPWRARGGFLQQTRLAQD